MCVRVCVVGFPSSGVAARLRPVLRTGEVDPGRDEVRSDVVTGADAVSNDGDDVAYPDSGACVEDVGRTSEVVKDVDALPVPYPSVPSTGGLIGCLHRERTLETGGTRCRTVRVLRVPSGTPCHLLDLLVRPVGLPRRPRTQPLRRSTRVDGEPRVLKSEVGDHRRVDAEVGCVQGTV